MNLLQAVEELTRNAKTADFNPLMMTKPGEQHIREFTYNGKDYRACLTRMQLDSTKYGWLLSLSYYPNGDVRPTEEEGKEIAAVFFGQKPWIRVPANLDMLKWSLKYMLVEEGK
jgi:hypothetical protein